MHLYFPNRIEIASPLVAALKEHMQKDAPEERSYLRHACTP